MRKLLIALMWLVLAGVSVDLIVGGESSPEPGDVSAYDGPGDIPPTPHP